MDKETLGEIGKALTDIWETLDSYNKRLKALEDLAEGK